MFGGYKLKLKPELLEKVQSASKVKGASSLDEFVERIIEKEVDQILAKAGKRQVSAAEVEDITNKLKGLGYLE